MPFEMIPIKLKVDTKHGLLARPNAKYKCTWNADEYFSNTPADLRHIS